MKRFSRKTSEKRVCGRRQAALETALLLAGIYGILLIFCALPQVSFSETAVFLGNALICAGLYALFSFRRKWILRGAAVLLLVLAAAAWLRRESAAVQLLALAESVSGTAAPQGTDVTFTVLIVSCALSICFFVLEIVWKRHWLPYTVITAIMAAAPLFGIRPGILSVLLCLAFQILFWTIHMPGSSGNRHKFSVPLRCSALMGILLAVLVGISAVLTSFWGSELSAAVYKGEGFISRSALRLTGRAADPNSDGHVSSGNNYRTGEQQLEVTLPQEPTQTLYLKGFTGGRYIGGEWEAADDEPVFQEMARDLEWERWETWISAIYDTLYFIMNRSSKEEAPEPRELTLEHTNGSYRTVYMPYFSGPVERRDTGGYGFHYYQEAELDLDWEYAYERNSMMTGWMWQVQDAYIEEIPNAYTEVPVELLPRLTQLCRANPADSLEEATALILTVLRENASYTLMPGRAPLNEDIVEYFLFENHEGYCVHFASAATLMYRLWGIPARYASGYALQPSDFTLQPDGTWKAEVTDAFAHAWTEIFLEDYGWTPVEFTPFADGSFDASYPGLDTQALTELLSTVNLRAEISGSTNESSDSGTESGQDFGEGFPDLSGVFSRYRFLLPIAGTALVISLLLIPLFLDYRRLRRRAQAERMNCREVFRRLMDMIHFAGFLSGCSGMEEDFAARFEKEIPCTEPGDAQRLVQIVSRAAYGRGEPSKEEEAFVKRIYFSTGEWLTGELKGFRRFQFRYLKAFF